MIVPTFSSIKTKFQSALEVQGETCSKMIKDDDAICLKVFSYVVACHRSVLVCRSVCISSSKSVSRLTSVINWDSQEILGC